MNKTAALRIPDEIWANTIASYAAEELVAGKLIAGDQYEFARQIIEQQILVSFFSNAYPAGDLSSN